MEKRQRWVTVDQMGNLAAGPFMYKPAGCPFGIGGSMPAGFRAMTEERYLAMKKARAKERKRNAWMYR